MTLSKELIDLVFATIKADPRRAEATLDEWDTDGYENTVAQAVNAELVQGSEQR